MDNRDKGMRLVNIFVVLALILRNQGMIFLACGLWIAYLVYSMRQAESKGTKVINGIFIAVAAGIMAVNAYFYIQNMGR